MRHSTPGVGLISPPPHHDIYSIEDLTQLIHDLKNVNPKARVSVKLVSEVGVGTVAAGVSKCKADHVTISGFEGGTGASPLTSLTHAGSPWEIGLAETHQTLVLNNLRGRIAVQVDGGLRTGRDVVIGALLGADEFGFATAPLIALGCIMMRKCHLNTCPVGVATQDPVLRKMFTGQPEHVINFFFLVAEEARELMATLGFRTVNEMIGRVDRLDVRRAVDHWKAHGLDLARLLYQPKVGPEVATFNCEAQEHGLDKALDHMLIAKAQPALENGMPVVIETEVRNVNRTVGAMLSGEVAMRFGHAGLPEDTIVVRAHGTGGQSFGAWLTRGVTFELVGVANDYVGKGLSGGRIVVYPPPSATFVPHREHRRRQHRAVRRHRGAGLLQRRRRRALRRAQFWSRRGRRRLRRSRLRIHDRRHRRVLGRTGVNFAAGMSGGIAYVSDPQGDFSTRCNLDQVELEPMAHEAVEPAPMTTGVDLSDLTRNDGSRLRWLVEQHLHYTNSARAREILANWEESVTKFVKVMPTEFRRALRELAAEQADRRGRGRRAAAWVSRRASSSSSAATVRT